MWNYSAYTEVPGWPDGKATPMKSYGAVADNYRIGQYEVTIEQFLKAQVASGMALMISTSATGIPMVVMLVPQRMLV